MLKRLRGKTDEYCPTMAKYLKPSTTQSDRDEMMTRTITKYLIRGMKPIAEVEKEAFVKMFSQIEPGYKMPTKKTI